MMDRITFDLAEKNMPLDELAHFVARFTKNYIARIQSNELGGIPGANTKDIEKVFINFYCNLMVDIIKLNYELTDISEDYSRQIIHDLFKELILN